MCYTVDWYILSCALVQRPLRVKGGSQFKVPKIKGQEMNRKAWKLLSNEEKAELKKVIEDLQAGFTRVLKDMPPSLFLILRWVRQA